VGVDDEGAAMDLGGIEHAMSLAEAGLIGLGLGDSHEIGGKQDGKQGGDQNRCFHNGMANRLMEGL